MDERLKKLEKRLDDYESRNTETAMKVEKVETRTVAVASEVKETVVNELKQQENRKTNIVVYNLKESLSEDGIERKKHDQGDTSQKGPYSQGRRIGFKTCWFLRWRMCCENVKRVSTTRSGSWCNRSSSCEHSKYGSTQWR